MICKLNMYKAVLLCKCLVGFCVCAFLCIALIEKPYMATEKSISDLMFYVNLLFRVTSHYFEI